MIILRNEPMKIKRQFQRDIYMRGSHSEVSISFSRQQEAQQQALSCKRLTSATKGPKPPAKKRQALPPGKSMGGENISNNNKK